MPSAAKHAVRARAQVSREREAAHQEVPRAEPRDCAPRLRIRRHPPPPSHARSRSPRTGPARALASALRRTDGGLHAQVANAAKVQTALKLSQEDQNTIGSLKREIEKAWKMVDSAHEKARSWPFNLMVSFVMSS